MCRLLEKPVYGGGKQLRNDQLAHSLFSCAAVDQLQQQQQQQSGAIATLAATSAAGSVQQPQPQVYSRNAVSVYCIASASNGSVRVLW
jgi:hypothetical protein